MELELKKVKSNRVGFDAYDVPYFGFIYVRKDGGGDIFRTLYLRGFSRGEKKGEVNIQNKLRDALGVKQIIVVENDN